MTEALPRIASVEAGAAPFTLAVTWKGGATDVIDMTGVVFRHEVFAPLRDPAAFASAQPASWGSGIEWPKCGLDYGADTLAMLAEEQRPMTGAAFKSLVRTIGVSTREIADMLGVAPGTIKNYMRAERVPTHVAIAMRAIARDPTVLGAHFRPRKAGRPRKTA